MMVNRHSRLLTTYSVMMVGQQFGLIEMGNPGNRVAERVDGDGSPGKSVQLARIHILHHQFSYVIFYVTWSIIL